MYFLSLINNSQALNAYQQFLSNYGAQIQYRAAGVSNTGYTLYNGQTYYNGGNIIWIAALKPSQGGVVGMIIGANGITGTKYQSTLAKIIKTIR